MKTLDEVIDAMSECFDEKYIITIFECDPKTGCDALHYLKEYRKHLEEDVAKNATAELERAENAYCNDVERAVRTERAWQAYRKERG